MNNTLLLHQENLDQRKKWMLISYMLVFVVVLEAILIFFLSINVANKRENIRYIEFSEKGDFGFRILPDSHIDFKQRRLLTEKFLQDYLVNRFTNVKSKVAEDSEVDSSKVVSVLALSSIKVRNQYEAELMRLYQSAAFIKRDIHILSFSEIEQRKYRFDFNTIDSYGDGEVKKQRWVVYLRFDYVNPNSLKNSYRSLNPLGIKITYFRGDVDKTKKIDIRSLNDQ